ncbi:MAG: ABC transporter permease [Christensenellaceae bacterium]|nr:ABC transporter permease [Christensenellaceae bacterium]
MSAIFKKEFKSFFTNMIGYIFISVILVFVGIYAVYVNFVSGSTAFELALSYVNIIFIVLIPLLTMNAFSVEKKQKTDQLLLTSPVSVTQIVLGKFFAIFTVYAIPMLVFCAYPLIYSLYGEVHFASAYGAIFGMIMMGAAMIAIGMFLSSVTESQIIAAVVTIGAFLLIYLFSGLAQILSASAQTSFFCLAATIVIVGLLIYLLSKNRTLSAVVMIVGLAVLIAVYLIDSSLLEGVFPAVLNKLAIFSRVNNFIAGIFDVTGIVYYLSVAVFFNLLTVQGIEKRRWS